MLEINKYKLTSGSIGIDTGKLVPVGDVRWGEVLGDIEKQVDLVEYVSTHAGTAYWGGITGTLSSQRDLMNKFSSYATQSWVESQGYLTSVPDSFATKAWVSDQGYLSAVPSEYATESYVTTALSGYATESYVDSAISSISVPENVVEYDQDTPLATDVGIDVLMRDLNHNQTNPLVLGYAKNVNQQTGDASFFRTTEVDGPELVQVDYYWVNGVGWEVDVTQPYYHYDPEYFYPVEGYFNNIEDSPVNSGFVNVNDWGEKFLIGTEDGTDGNFRGLQVNDSGEAGCYIVTGETDPETGDTLYSEEFYPYLTKENGGLKWMDEGDRDDLLAGVDLTFCDLIDRPNDWNPIDGYYTAPYVIGLTDEPGCSKATFVDGDSLFFKYVEHIEQGSDIVDRVFDGEYYQQWPGWYPLENHNVESDPDYFGLIPEGYPMMEGVDVGAPLNIGHWDINGTWSFSGISISDEGAGIYTIEPVEDGSETTYEENYDPFATESYVTSAISSAIGVAMSITNEILS